jgi:hypothetical protein
MARPKATNFIIGLVWIGFFAVVFAAFIAGLSSNYNVGFSEENVTLFNKFDKLNEIVEDVEKEARIEEDTGWIDKIGGYFSAGFKAIRVTLGSLNVFNTMINDAFGSDSLNLGIAGESLKAAIVTTVLILFIIGIVLRQVIKTDI